MNDVGMEPKGKVLFTGSSDLAINDLMAHMPDNFKVEKCPPNEMKFIHALERFRPHAIVCVLTEKTEDTSKIAYVVEENLKFSNTPILAVGSQAACTFFQKNVFRSRVTLLERPLNHGQLMEYLCAYAAEGIATDLEVDAAAKEPIKKAAPPEVPPSPTPPPGRSSILVVDDDILMLNTLKMYLQDLYDVTVVPSGKLAIKFLSKKNADLVLLDYMMPGEDGPAVLRQIRQESPCPDVPVVFLTGVNDRSLVLRCLELRPSGYLLKPVTKEALLERVTEILLGL